MIETNNRKALNKAVREFSETILQDVLFKSIPSVKAPNGFYMQKMTIQKLEQSSLNFFGNMNE